VIDIIHITKFPRGLRQAGRLAHGSSEQIKRVLIIGGSGYLGSHTVRLFLEKGYDVRVLDNLLYAKQGLSDIANTKNLEFIEGDIRNIDTLVNAIQGVDAVIHLAAIVGDPACGINADFTLDVNYTATRTIAQLCVHHFVKRFIFASTCSVYGYSEDLITEESGVNPLSLYAKSKLESENGILELEDGSFSPTILRLATLYGLSPRMRFDLVINLLTMKAITDKKIIIDGGGKQWRPYVHAYDAARAFLAALEAPEDKIKGAIFNVGSKEQCCQVIQLGDMIKRRIPEVKITMKEDAADKRSYNVSCDKIRKVLGFKPTRSIDDGIVEIKDALESNRISDLDSKEYNNYRFLVEKLAMEE
jgi:nucleoside-diphosphate-sugar epimerase